MSNAKRKRDDKDKIESTQKVACKSHLQSQLETYFTSYKIHSIVQRFREATDLGVACDLITQVMFFLESLFSKHFNPKDWTCHLTLVKILHETYSSTSQCLSREQVEMFSKEKAVNEYVFGSNLLYQRWKYPSYFLTHPDASHKILLSRWSTSTLERILIEWHILHGSESMNNELERLHWELSKTPTLFKGFSLKATGDLHALHFLRDDHVKLLFLLHFLRLHMYYNDLRKRDQIHYPYLDRIYIQPPGKLLEIPNRVNTTWCTRRSMECLLIHTRLVHYPFTDGWIYRNQPTTFVNMIQISNHYANYGWWWARRIKEFETHLGDEIKEEHTPCLFDKMRLTCILNAIPCLATVLCHIIMEYASGGIDHFVFDL